MFFKDKMKFLLFITLSILLIAVFGFLYTKTVLSTPEEGSSIYNFLNIVENKAYQKGGAEPISPQDPGLLEAQAGNYDKLKSSNDLRWSTDMATSEGEYDSQVYAFTLESSADVYRLKINLEGYGEKGSGYTTYLKIWDNVNSQWVNLDSKDFHDTIDDILSSTISSDVSDFIDANHKVYVLASSQSCAKECSLGETQCKDSHFSEFCGEYDGDSCLEFGGNIDCSQSDNLDGDSIACNCDCGDYDVSEANGMGNCDDGIDNDCDGNTDWHDSDCCMADASSCPDDYACCSGICGQDNDGDGYGGNGPGPGTCLKTTPFAGDCNDSDARIHPGQTSFFSPSDLWWFDWNCDGYQTFPPDSNGYNASWAELRWTAYSEPGHFTPGQPCWIYVMTISYHIPMPEWMAHIPNCGHYGYFLDHCIELVDWYPTNGIPPGAYMRYQQCR